MTEDDFQRLAALGFNRIPLVLETLSDLETPVSIYLKLANRPNTFLLESVIGGERHGRYSYVGLATSTQIRASGRMTTVVQNGHVIERGGTPDPLDFVRAYLARFRAAEIPDLPRFRGGLVGYFGYDAVRWIEHRLGGGWQRPDELGCPDLLLLLCDELAVIDNLTGRLYLIVYADPARPGAYRDAKQRLRELNGALHLPIHLPPEPRGALGVPRSNFTPAEFESIVERARQYIEAGDAMQVVLAQRFSQTYPGTPLSFYRALRTINPSPYMFFFDFGDFHVIGASPEILVHAEAGTATVRPLAGTRRRGDTVEADRALEAELLADPKERAEHVMLLDLGRNDLGRIAATGSVRVTEQMVIERYSHVMHIVSNVEARIDSGHDWIDVLRAVFPAGTLSGAPKVRAMEIIDELERDKRGIYGGAVGCIGFDGNMDLAIAIRTAVLKDGVLHVQAGAGVVFDSVPASEAEETRNKALALMRAATMAHREFGDGGGETR